VSICLAEVETQKPYVISPTGRVHDPPFLTSGSPQVPLAEFLEVDDYDSTRELLTVHRGSDGGKKMYSPGD
jgi:hypothetical protein